MTATRTTVSCLRGMIRTYGPSLEHAPDGCIYVGRRMTMGGWRLPQSDWANPFSISKDAGGSAEIAVAMYEAWLYAPEQDGLRARIVPELSGFTLLCWCNGAPCHGFVLARIANQGPDQYVDFAGRVDAATALRRSRNVETVKAVGDWSGAL